MRVEEPFLTVEGHVSPGFEPVANVFTENFRLGREANAQCCVYVGEDKVVDLWGTSAEAENKNYDGDTLQLVFSTTKTITSIAFASLLDRGLLNYDQTVSSVWPEFAANGKDSITIADVMRHEAGLVLFDGKFSGEEAMLTANIKDNSIGKVIESTRPQFPPDTFASRREYHKVTRGFILNEIFRRVDPVGRTLGEWAREELRVARADLLSGIYLGCADDEAFSRKCDISTWGPAYSVAVSFLPGFISRRSVIGPMEMCWRLYRHIKGFPPKYPWDSANKDAPLYDNVTLLSGEIPSVNSLCSARSLAALGAYMANGGKLGNDRLMTLNTWKKVHGGPKVAKDYDDDEEGISPNQFTQGGINYFDVYPNESASMTNVRRQRQGFYGWHGFGGSVLQWHPQKRVSFAYAPTLLAWYDPLSRKAATLQEEVVKCVDRLEKI